MYHILLDVVFLVHIMKSSLYIHTYIYIHLCIYVCMYVRMCSFIYVCLYTCVDLYMYDVCMYYLCVGISRICVCIFISTRICMYLRIYNMYSIYIYLYVYVCRCIYVYIYVYVYVKNWVNMQFFTMSNKYTTITYV